jgi:adenylate kinase
MDAGELVSDAIVNAIVPSASISRIAPTASSSTAIPRTLVQADALEAMLAERACARCGDRVQVDDKVAGRPARYNRAEAGRKAAGQPVRKDDNPEVFDERLRRNTTRRPRR